GAGGLRENDDGRVVAGEDVAVGVLDRRGQGLGRAGGDAARVGGEDHLGRGAGGDREGGAVAAEAGVGGGDRERAGALCGDGQRGDTAGRPRGAEPRHRARTRGLREDDNGRVVRRDDVVVGVFDRRGQGLG